MNLPPNINEHPMARERYCEERTMSNSKQKDPVDHPPHYNIGAYEVIDVIEDWRLGFHLGNAVKYIARAGRKDPAKEAEDLRKAIWYIERHIIYRKGLGADGHMEEADHK